MVKKVKCEYSILLKEYERVDNCVLIKVWEGGLNNEAKSVWLIPLGKNASADYKRLVVTAFLSPVSAPVN